MDFAKAQFVAFLLFWFRWELWRARHLKLHNELAKSIPHHVEKET